MNPNPGESPGAKKHAKDIHGDILICKCILRM